MKQLNSSLQGLFDVLASELQSRLFPGHVGDAAVSWGGDSAEGASSDLIWWSWSLSIDAECRVLAGASLAAWKEISGSDAEADSTDLGGESIPARTPAALTPAIQEAGRSRFGAEVTSGAAEHSEEPPSEWTSVLFSIKPAARAAMAVHFSISPALEAALGGSPADREGPQEPLATHAGPAGNSAAILMHVEMPVTIVLGRTKMRLKDLLRLTNGSVVELDQALDDEVEIRVNNCVIAYGQVVAVDGNYAVRVLRMAPARNAPNLRGILPEKAA